MRIAFGIRPPGACDSIAKQIAFGTAKRIQLFNDDCLVQLPKIKEKVDLVLVDLPYGQTDCNWDISIDLKKMWKELKKICKRDCVYVFFCTTKFGYKLIQSNERWFRYDLVWEKSRSVGFLNANKMPLRKHEMMYVFSGDSYTENKDLDNSRNLGLRAYAKMVKAYINKPIKEIDKVVGNQGIHHFYRLNSTQFGLPSEKTYDVLIEKYSIDKMEGFRTYESLKAEWENTSPKTYNPQKTNGKPYKNRITPMKHGVYGEKTKTMDLKINKGDRYPISIIKFNNPKKSFHNTQKPVALCEWLIKTYSNEGDIVLDFTMGSGSTGVACINTKRRFVGIEKNHDIFKTARNRLIQCELSRV
jgi:DNA modification methylase